MKHDCETPAVGWISSLVQLPATSEKRLERREDVTHVRCVVGVARKAVRTSVLVRRIGHQALTVGLHGGIGE